MEIQAALGQPRLLAAVAVAVPMLHLSAGTAALAAVAGDKMLQWPQAARDQLVKETRAESAAALPTMAAVAAAGPVGLEETGRLPRAVLAALAALV